MEVKLSKRLLAIAERIPLGSRLADIGSDHALLPVYAVQQGIVSFAIAGEVNVGPLQAAQKQIAEAGLSQLVLARKGDGLEVLSPGEVTVITIAGMGGALMASILDKGMDKLAGVEALILQPNVGESIVREWLLRNNWLLIEETILEEDGLFYEVLKAVPARSQVETDSNADLYTPIQWESGVTALKELQLLMGPHLLRAPTTVLLAKWNDELRKRTRIIAQMDQAAAREAAEKREALTAEADKIREVLSCLHTDKPSSS